LYPDNLNFFKRKYMKKWDYLADKNIFDA
jgi:hypothetical protein